MNTINLELLYENIKEQHPKLFKRKKEKVNYNTKKLLGVELNQSESIRFGRVLEVIVKEITKLYSNSTEIVDINLIKTESIFSCEVEQDKQIDLLVKTQNNYYYLESKVNCELDTEKWPATIQKIDKVSEAIQNYFNCECIGKILTPWYRYEDDMPLQYKRNNIMFIGQYFQAIGIDFVEEAWYSMLNNYAQKWLQDIR